MRNGRSGRDMREEAYRLPLTALSGSRCWTAGSLRGVECEFQGPTAGADRAVLLAHGAGADRNAPALGAVADALEAVGVPSLRFDYPYRSAGRRAPDRPPVLDRATRDAAEELAARSGVPPARLVLGGRSMGGRVCSLVERPPSTSRAG